MKFAVWSLLTFTNFEEKIQRSFIRRGLIEIHEEVECCLEIELEFTRKNRISNIATRKHWFISHNYKINTKIGQNF